MRNKIEVDVGYYYVNYELLKSVFSVYGKMMKYRVDDCVVDSVVQQVIVRLPVDIAKVIEFEVLYKDFDSALCKLKDVFKDESDTSYLVSDENVVFKIVYVLCKYYVASSVYCFFLIIILLKSESLYSCVFLFQPKWLKSLSFVNEDDFTCAYFEMLEWLNQQLHKEVELVVDDRRLIEYYPFLHNEQVSFWLNHQNEYCYYTIQQYMKYNNVCYETARMHLEQLVRLGWYIKKKVGKKFVYSRRIEYGV